MLPAPLRSLASRLLAPATLSTLLLLGLVAACATSEGPRSERLRADVEWLADDAREGRRAGMPGEADAVRWIAKRLEALGCRPAGEEGFLQRFPVPLPARDGGGSFVVLREAGAEGIGSERRLEAVEPLFCSAGGGARGRAYFRGYGIQDEGLGWLEYGEGEAARLPEGSIVLVVRGVPRAPREPAEKPAEKPASGEHPPAGGGFAHGASLLHKVMTAKRFGAAAVLVCQHPSEGGQPLLRFDDASGGEAGIPALMISIEEAQALVPGLIEQIAALDAPGARPAVAGPLALEVELRADVLRETGMASNVLGLVPGRGGRTVVIGAHLDHLGRGGPGSLDRAGQGEIHNGADDNASGVAVVLEMARELMRREEPPAGDVLVALWSGEELGLLGSEHWCSRPTIAFESVGAKLNLDMVGRVEEKRLMVLGAGTSPAFADWMGPAGERAALSLEVSLSATGIGGSDHQPFVKRGVPSLHLFSGLHSDYHRPSDTADRFRAEEAAKVASLGLDLLARMQAAPELPFVAPPAPERGETRPRGFSVRFGTQPSYSYSGKGLMLEGTSPGSPAERAGLVAGDLIVRIDDLAIESVHDFTYVLQIHKAGDVLRTTFVRDGVEQTVLVTLESRDVE